MKTGVLLIGGTCERCANRIEDRKPGAKLCGGCNYLRRKERAILARCGYKIPLKRDDRIKVSAARMALGAAR